MPRHRPDEVSAGGVLARPVGAQWEVCLVRAGRYWGLPKGHVELGETARDAALREISEECGVDEGLLTVIAELPRSEYAYQRAGRLIFKRVEHFLVTAPQGTALVPQASEIDAAVWLPFDDAAGRASFRDTRVALQAARALLVAMA